MNMVYKIYTTLTGTSENMPMYNQRTADYVDRVYDTNDLVVYNQDTVKNSDIESDVDENLKTWKTIHSDWNTLFENQREMPQAKYVEQARFLAQVIEDLDSGLTKRRLNIQRSHGNILHFLLSMAR